MNEHRRGWTVRALCAAACLLMSWSASAEPEPERGEPPIIPSPDGAPTATTVPPPETAARPTVAPDPSPPTSKLDAAPAEEGNQARSPDTSQAVTTEAGEGAEPPASPVAGEPQTSAEDEATAAEAAALIAQIEAETSGPLEAAPSLELYGFADFSFYKMFIAPGSAIGALVATQPSFAVGNLNLYLSSDLGEGWEALSEVRFTYLPNGSRSVDLSTGEVERTETFVADYTNFWRERRVGGIFIERAWLQYTADPLFSVRGGQWLTPYGIWNVDHGSPTIIPVVRPYIIGLELLPEAQTGVLVRGLSYPTETVSLGYAVGLSNGRGPVQEYGDLDRNKAVTLRVHGTHRGEGTLAFGLSGYYGRYTDIQQSTQALSDGVEIVEDIVEQYDELSLGADLKYNLDGLHLQGEFILNERKYTEAGRTLHAGTTFTPDIRRYGGYGVFGYRFDWLGLMPYLAAEYFVVPNILELTRPPTQDRIYVATLGLNSRPTHNVTLKLEGNYGGFSGDIPESSAFADPVGGIQAQAAWAF